MKYVLKYLGITFLVLALISFRLLKMASSLPGGFGFFVVLGIIFSICGGFLIRKAKRLGQKKEGELLKLDKRRPIIYLRSFLDDPKASVAANDSLLIKFLPFGTIQNLNSEEEQMALAIKGFGPFVAIGNPKEPLPQLGASRIYAENSSWQDVVLDLIQKSQLVLMRVGETPGFWWEVKTVLAHAEPTKIVFMLSDNRDKYNAFKIRLEQEYSVTIPIEYNPVTVNGQSFSAILTFAADWKASILYCKEQANWFFHNGVTADFKEMIQYALNKKTIHEAQQFERSRTKFQRTSSANIQRIGGIIFLGLIISAIFTSILESCTHQENIEAGSPIMLTTWGICSLLLYLLISYGERPQK